MAMRALQFAAQRSAIFSHTKNSIRTKPLCNQCFSSVQKRMVSSRFNRTSSTANTTTGMYMLAIVVLTATASYAAVPLYRIFCQATGYGGTVQEKRDTDLSDVVPQRQRPIRIRFNADTSGGMRWHFKPQQPEVRVVPGESALAFYTASNPTGEAITGISTYNVIPFEAGQYFNKIQCFCFEEQRLNPHEQVDMPVFFYIDPEFVEDPAMSKVREITLSYTFFESKNFDYSKWSGLLPAPPTSESVPAKQTA